jgi:arabinan endo-1,5-alpha-L-arabinosidase
MTATLSFRRILAAPLLFFLATALPLVAGEPDEILVRVYRKMATPVEYPDYTIHDPSRIITVGGLQMIAVTGKAQEDGYDCGIETWFKAINSDVWRPGQCLFRKGNKPSWIAKRQPNNDGAYWAPELDLKDGKLTLIYSVAEMGLEEEQETTCVGVAYVKNGLEGFPRKMTWEDAGQPMNCIKKSDYPDMERSTIDPSVFWGMGRDKNRLFMVTGGGRIIGTELDPNTYFQKDDEFFDLDKDDWTQLATGPEDDAWVEASYIYPNKKLRYYYLFVNWGACCSGVDSTYEIRVGRSRNPMGPFLDKDGVDMMEGGGSVFEQSRGWVIGPGHTGIRKRGKTEYVSYHYYDKRREGNSWIVEREIKWKDGWPKPIKKFLNPFPANQIDP